MKRRTPSVTIKRGPAYMEMINNVLSFPQVPDATQVKPTPDVPKEIPASDASSKSKSQNDSDNSASSGQGQAAAPYYTLRLTVDKDPNTGEWIYRAIDRYTGKVVSEMPRQALLDLRQSDKYKAGSVINTGA